MQRGWLSTFLKIYVRAFQQSSDLDDSIEELLLVGDKPKPMPSHSKMAPLKDRVLERVETDLAEVMLHFDNPILSIIGTLVNTPRVDASQIRGRYVRLARTLS
jgi:hypothetical protein